MTHRPRLTAAGIALALAAGFLGLPTPATGQTNLAPNPSFELSVAEGSIVGPSPIHGTLVQPVLPTGWIVEGAAGLFDHAHPWFLGDERKARTGQRFVQISIPLSGNRSTTCQGNATCFGLLTLAKDEARRAYSVDPVWRTAAPIAVTPGKTYTISVHVQLEFSTLDTGAFAAVRWLNASGDPLSVSPRAQVLQSQGDLSKTWTGISRSVTAPPGAAAAVILLGSTGDMWISSIRFDDVFFG